ncbi:protein kinase domain-containing protein [Chondromyces apiculatus]|uniref:Serine/threonine protein kinase n=1 Tax=Chondromyces apiculatus DSM 436 TaxID=1192034 RepID=A0A017TEV7_9BACT|nr:protein kinase [Chondromyces apiculatus]EYF07779.1 serine/threonine protein kinase [Chondromyces apiculatus DSM 436]
MTAASHLIGQTVAGRFKITGFIGEGAMAAVYLGEQERDPHEVAIKIMHPQMLGDATFVGRFRREARAASALDHPNTVHIIDYGVDGNLPYIAMERLHGRDLFDILVREHRLTERRAAEVLVGVCEALEAAHQHGIVHRDLKPENIMLVRSPSSASDLVKVLDFGIAKIVETSPTLPLPLDASPALDPSSVSPASADPLPAPSSADPPRSFAESPPSSITSTAISRVGVTVGTPAYMSPEQCRGEPVDGRSDLYTCGILLFLLVTGRLPFPAVGSPWDVAMERLRRPPPAPSTFVPRLHPGLEAVILKALATSPEDRQQSARELRDALTRLLPELSGTLLFGDPAMAPLDTDTLPLSIRNRQRIAARSALGMRDGRDGRDARDVREPARDGSGPRSAITLSSPRLVTDAAPRRTPSDKVRLLLPTGDTDPTLDIDDGAPSLKTRLIPRALADRALADRAHVAPLPPPRSSSPRSSSPRAASLLSDAPSPDAEPSPAAAPPSFSPDTLLPGHPEIDPPTPLVGSSYRALTERPPPPVPPARTLAARLVVPLALVIGIALGLVAFLLMTR